LHSATPVTSEAIPVASEAITVALEAIPVASEAIIVAEAILMSLEAAIPITTEEAITIASDAASPKVYGVLREPDSEL
jgi:hypothetical protein